MLNCIIFGVLSVLLIIGFINEDKVIRFEQRIYKHLKKGGDSHSGRIGLGRDAR